MQISSRRYATVFYRATFQEQINLEPGDELEDVVNDIDPNLGNYVPNSYEVVETELHYEAVLEVEPHLIEDCNLIFLDEKVKFQNGYQMVIQIKAGWNQAVLFDETGTEVCFTEPKPKLFGEWSLGGAFSGDSTYSCIVKMPDQERLMDEILMDEIQDDAIGFLPDVLARKTPGFYLAYPVENELKVNNVHERAIEGKAVFEAFRDEFYSIGDNSDYVSEVVENPTNGDIFRLFCESMEKTQDFHHSFYEGFYETNKTTNDGVKIYRFATSS